MNGYLSTKRLYSVHHVLVGLLKLGQLTTLTKPITVDLEWAGYSIIEPVLKLIKCM